MPKEHVKISTFAKFESYMLETGKDMDPQSREILDFSMVGGKSSHDQEPNVF